jgi:hypothetical protein
VRTGTEDDEPAASALLDTGKHHTDRDAGRGPASGLKHPATSRISVRVTSLHTVSFDNASFADSTTADEYTALQKYISTYRDPKAAAAEAGEGDGEKKKKPWWKVSCLRRRRRSNSTRHV